MKRKAKHDFKLQVRPGEFIQFKQGQTIPEEYHDIDSPFKDFIEDHSDGMIIKTQIIKSPEMTRITEMPMHVAKQEEAREKIMSHPVDHKLSQAPQATPVQVAKVAKPAHRK